MNSTDDKHVYIAPMLECQHSNNDLSSIGRDPERMCCNILIPFPVLPSWHSDSDPEDDGIAWPPESWKCTFVCLDCGLVQEFSEEDICWVLVSKPSPGKYRNDTNCFSVELVCARTDCKASMKVYVELHDRTENDLRNEIKKGFMGNWPSGHPAMAHPHQAPKIERVYLGPI